MDFFISSPALYMNPDKGDTLPPQAVKVHKKANATIFNHTGVIMQPIEREDFYKQADKGFVVVQVRSVMFISLLD